MSPGAAVEPLSRLSRVFAVHKPVGWTSADVVRKIRAVLCTEMRSRGAQVKLRSIKLGHGGTLDCRAAGVLVLGLGKGTKQLHNLLNTTQKRYIAEGLLGKATDTYDTGGEITEEKHFDHITEDTFRQTMDTFRGEQMQVAPIYSALKVGGERMSDRVRRGETVEPKPPRPVVVHSLELLSFNPPHFQLAVTCGAGFYVRSLVHDLGHAVDSCAHMTSLCRVQQGLFTLQQALPLERWTLPDIEAAVHI
ncbi:probable tRNA pseudouridine synthase 1 isoform X1 [Branchiostoma floridae]|uniref:tRNA pseudouridine(55) synthase n=1 Tax=Branchiostoma floridae TaxID=7739 RepID=A0A9J7L348_BRAFL|nr:probable tRNA pseudouridine synthase 1 isoform X1 [Branchiostoma floridae]